jgi:hypothetical protein
MAIDIPDTPSLDDLLPTGSDREIRFRKYAGSYIWKKLNSRVFIFDGKTPSDDNTAVFDGGTV